MNSPFPGMDPYLESKALWSGFHNGLAYEIQGQLNEHIQPDYFARLTPAMRVTYQVIEVGRTRGIYPDVSIWRSPMPTGRVANSAVMITPAPVESSVALEMPLRTHSIEIRTTTDEELILVIEILSPVNKRLGHEAQHDYLRKRRDLLRSSVHLLEIDLLREGQRPPLVEVVPEAPYYIALSRENRRPTVEVWPIQLADTLPVLPVPLREPDPDVPLDLGAAVASVYKRGAYASQIDYHQLPPPPPLSETEMKWVDDLLREKGKR